MTALARYSLADEVGPATEPRDLATARKVGGRIRRRRTRGGAPAAVSRGDELRDPRPLRVGLPDPAPEASDAHRRPYRIVHCLTCRRAFAVPELHGDGRLPRRCRWCGGPRPLFPAGLQR